MAELDTQPPVHDEIHAIPPEDAAHDKGAGSPPNVPFAAEIPPSPPHDRERCHCRPDQTPLWKQTLEFIAAVCGIALVIITLYYTRAAYRQAAASEIAANAAKSAADTASQTLQQMKDSSKANSEATFSTFKQEERAYIGVTSYVVPSDPVLVDPNGNKHYCIDVHFVDGGKTPAVGNWITRKVAYGESGKSEVEGLIVPKYPNSVGEVSGPGAEKWATGCTEPIDDTTLGNLKNKQVVTYIYGVVQYKDIFGDYHQTGFCGERPKGFEPFHYCDFGNWFDERKGNKQKGKNEH